MFSSWLFKNFAQQICQHTLTYITLTSIKLAPLQPKRKQQWCRGCLVPPSPDRHHCWKIGRPHFLHPPRLSNEMPMESRRIFLMPCIGDEWWAEPCDVMENEKRHGEKWCTRRVNQLPTTIFLQPFMVSWRLNSSGFTKANCKGSGSHNIPERWLNSLMGEW